VQTDFKKLEGTLNITQRFLVSWWPVNWI